MDVKEVLETAIEVMKQAFIDEQRIEIQGFAVIEVKYIEVKKPNTLITFNGKLGRLPKQRMI